MRATCASLQIVEEPFFYSLDGLTARINNKYDFHLTPRPVESALAYAREEVSKRRVASATKLAI